MTALRWDTDGCRSLGGGWTDYWHLAATGTVPYKPPRQIRSVRESNSFGLLPLLFLQQHYVVVFGIVNYSPRWAAATFGPGLQDPVVSDRVDRL
jgi:hypothetical protein